MAIDFARELEGQHIYQTKKRTFYYDVFSKKAYIITDDKAQEFSRLQKRYYVGIILAAASILIFHQVIWGCILGVALIVIMEIRFRMYFLKKLNTQENFTKEKYADYEAFAPNPTRRILVVMALVSIVILVLMYKFIY